LEVALKSAAVEQRLTNAQSDPEKSQGRVGQAYAAGVTQLDGATLVVGLHLEHPNSVIQLLGH
jgi:hypothetical protein